MTIRVGIIGTGLIGEDHGRKLVNVINGSTGRAPSRTSTAPAPQEVATPRAAAPRSSTTGIDAHRVRPGRRGPRHLDRRHARGVRAGLHRGRQAGHVREAAGPHRPRVRADPRGRGRLRQAARDRRLHAPLRPGLPAGQGAPSRPARSATPLMLHNIHRNATVGPEAVHQLHDDDRLDDPRGRHHALDARRGDHVGPGHPAEAHAQGVPAPPGPAVRGVRRRSPGSCRPSSSSPTASTATTSAASSWARWARHRWSTRHSRRRSRRARSPSVFRPTGASASAPRTPPSSRPGSRGCSTARASARPPGRATRRPRWWRSASRP